MINNRFTVCLLGATGFLGSAIAKELDRKKITWLGLSRDASDDNRIKRVNFSEYEQVVDIFKKSDIVINALGSAKPKDFENNPQETLNTIWSNMAFLAKLLKEGDVSKLVHISSAGTVYGEQVEDSHHENSDLLPISWYGKAKVIEELYLEKACESNQFDYLCCRVTNPYGNEKKTTHGFIDVLMNCVLSGKEFSYYQDCNPVRDFIYADDMAFSIVTLIEKNCIGIFNVGSGDSYSLEDIANYVCNKYPEQTYIKRLYKKPHYDVLRNRVSIDKLRDISAYKNTKSVYAYIDNILEKSSK